ncbi:hypothetical protein NT6N_25080 [Oceaniferula spumae]|uniref:Glycosyltransferase family 8 protein n=1 Tax=Oceaniferula spumae TaxID=2979115 RepID=A0AAT9FNE1_9BACT
MTDAPSYLNLALSSDANYFIGLETAVASAITASHKNTRVFNIFIIDGGITQEQQQQLKSLTDELSERYEIEVHLHWRSLDEKNRSKLSGLKDSATFYVRIILADLLPDYDWALWIDSDVLCLKDLSGIQNHLDGNTPVYGVVDSERPTLADEGQNIDKLNSNDFDLRTPYINTGFTLIDLKLWRKERLGDQLIDWGIRHQHYTGFRDQAQVNWMLADRNQLLPDGYNVLVPRSTCSAHEFDSPANLHYAGPFKPWKPSIKVNPKYTAQSVRNIISTYKFCAFRHQEMGRREIDLLQQLLTLAQQLYAHLTSRTVRFYCAVKPLFYQLVRDQERYQRWQVIHEFFKQEADQEAVRIKKIIDQTEALIKTSR